MTINITPILTNSRLSAQEIGESIALQAYMANGHVSNGTVKLSSDGKTWANRLNIKFPTLLTESVIEALNIHVSSINSVVEKVKEETRELTKIHRALAEAKHCLNKLNQTFPNKHTWR
jgi:DNA-binding protein YbaB